MSTITREWLQQAINDYESVRDELPFGLDDYQGNILAALRIALASLEAEPIGAFHIAEQQVDGTSDYIKDGEWPIDNGIIEVYAAPPVPVVPAALPENDDEDGHDIDYLEPSEVYALGRTAGWNACRAAMLQGKSEQPQNAQQNIPENIPGGNYPVTPDGWVMVPKEPTQAMIKAWLSEIANFRGHAAGYRAAIEAAPQLEVNRG
ncbi:DUF551 domain-containing protein [Escherichia coli]|nr:DUF551 domain-containing protein [Escherichia coli]